jgi:hypothetical protein
VILPDCLSDHFPFEFIHTISLYLENYISNSIPFDFLAILMRNAGKTKNSPEKKQRMAKILP